MNPTWRNLATAAVVIAGLGSQARAQMMGPYQPPISPYINIFRGGAPPAINYFNIVQPQLQFNDAIGQLQMQQNVLGQAVSSGQNNATNMTTGHSIAFGNYMQFYHFPRGGGMGGMGGGGGMGGMGMGGMGGGGMGGGMGGMGMGGMGMGGMGGMGMGGMGGMGMGGMGGMGMGGGGMGMGGMGMGGMGMGGMGR